MELVIFDVGEDDHIGIQTAFSFASLMLRILAN